MLYFCPQKVKKHLLFFFFLAASARVRRHPAIIGQSMACATAVGEEVQDAGRLGNPALIYLKKVRDACSCASA